MTKFRARLTFLAVVAVVVVSALGGAIHWCNAVMQLG